MKPKVEKIKAHNENHALEVLIRSLMDDPTKVWYFPEITDRIPHATWIISRMSRVLAEYDHKYALVDGGKIVAVAMWIPPGKAISYLQMLRHGLMYLPFRVGLGTFLTIMSSLNKSEEVQKNIMEGRKHWQLFYIGVDPNHQRKGYGSMLLEPIFEMADQKKDPIFLQNFTVENTNFYQKNGFVIKSLHDFGSNRLMRNMLREPK